MALEDICTGELKATAPYSSSLRLRDIAVSSACFLYCTIGSSGRILAIFISAQPNKLGCLTLPHSLLLSLQKLRSLFMFALLPERSSQL
mmetsp:Transcript_1293/g.1739  ORF Transcript_1293/g.1739 Transcript_1293/m.1739 type:complete len:89 (-) Transcript_1293:230-496(-)